MKKRSISGGGAKYSLNSSKSVFKPLIASSLALALGVSVATATDPTFQYGTEGISNNSIQNPTNITVSGVTWSDTNGLLKPTASGTTIDTINIVFDTSNGSNGSGTVSGSAITITGGGKITSSRQPVLQLTSSQGIMLGSDGSGKIAIDFQNAAFATSNDGKSNSRTFVLDLSGVASGVALQGNIEIGTGSATEVEGWANENSFIAKFGGSGMDGDITISKTGGYGGGDGLKGTFIFSNNANLDGNFILEENDRPEPKNTITFENGDILGKFSSKSNGSTTIIYGQGNKTIASSLDIMRGTLTYQFANTVSSNKIFTLDTSKANISGGKVVFDGVSQLVFKNGSSEGGTLAIAPKTDGSTYQNGSLVINLDSSAQANANNPIIKGSLSAINGTITLQLKDTNNVTGSNPFADVNATTPTNTYYVDGSIVITNGGFSAFWNDSIGFYGKVSNTYSSANGGLIGNINAWFEGGQSFSTIQATNGTSHIVFQDTATITGDLNNVAIYSLYGKAMVLFKSASTISGSIVSQTSGGSGNPNIIFAKSGITLGDAQDQEELYIYSGGTGWADTKNLIEIDGTTTIKGKISLVTDRNSDYDTYETHQNILKFNGTVEGDGVISEISSRNGSSTTSITSSSYNVLTFEGDTKGEITVGYINKKETVDGKLGSTIYIGKGLTSGSGESLALNTTLFSGDNDWNKASHQANIKLNVGEINTLGATHYINVAEINAQSINADLNGLFKGINNIVVGSGAIREIGVTGDGINNITSLENVILGTISAEVGFNNITVGGTSQLTDNLITNATTGGAINQITATDTLVLGSDKGGASIIAGGSQPQSGTNTIIANTLDGTLAYLTAGTSNGWGAYSNTITANSGTLVIENMKTQNYTAAGQSGNSATNTLTLKSGSITIDNLTSNGNGVSTMKNELILGQSGAVTAIINGNTSSNGSKTSTLFTLSDSGSSLTFNGNITNTDSAVTNVTLSSDDIVVTLKGTDSNISTLTALSSATNGNTLALDASNNNSVVATVATLANGDVLKVNFAGIDNIKSTKLTLDTTTATNRNLKSVSVASGTNNTLVVTGTDTMTIGSASIGDTSGTALKAIIFDLTSGSNLNFTSGLTTNAKGMTTFELGTTNTIAGTLTNSGIHNFNLNEATTTFKYGTGLTFSSGENNINFNADNITLNWQGASDTTNHAITTSGASTVTNLNFNNSGTLASGISTTDGTTNIKIANGKTATIGGAITTTSGATNVIFEAGVARAPIYSTLNIFEASNKITSVTSSANARIAIEANEGATIDNVTINDGASLLFAFSGAGNSTVTATNGITVEEGATLGISLAGTDTSTKEIAGNIVFKKGSTLLIDFQNDNKANGKIGNGDPFEITAGSKSIVNFWGTNSGKLNADALGNSINVNGGDNTVNFYGTATLSGIGFGANGGTNTINVDDGTSGHGITGTVILSPNSSIGSVKNTINLGDYATLDIQDGGGTSGSGTLTSSASSKANELNFNGNNATFNGAFGASGNGVATVNVNGENAIITSYVTNSSLVFGENGAGLTLNGKALAQQATSTHTLASISSDSTNNTLTLDTTGASNITTVSGDVNASGLTINLAGDSNVATFELSKGGSIGGISVASGNETKNIFSLKGGETSIASKILLDTGKGLDIQFNGASTLNLAQGYDANGGTAKISVNTGDSILKGGEVIASELAFNNTALSIQNNEASFGEVSGNGTLVLDGANGATIAGKPSVKVTLTDVTGNLTAKFNGSEAKGTELVMSKTGQTLDAIAFGTNSANNKLTLATGTTTITDKLDVAQGSGITLSLANSTELALTNGSDARVGASGSKGAITLSLADSATATISGGDAKITNLDFNGTASQTLNVKNANATFGTLIANNTAGSILNLDASSSAVTATINTISGENLAVTLDGNSSTNKATLNLYGGVIKSVVSNGGADANEINFNSGTTTINQAIDENAVANTKGLTLNLNGGNLILDEAIDTTLNSGTGVVNVIANNATLQLKGGANKINSLKGNGVVDLAVADFNGNTVTRSVRARAFKTFTIANYSGNHTFNLYVDPKAQGSTKADQVIVTDKNPSGSATFTVTGNIDDILGITYEKGGSNNVQIASGMTNIEVSGGDSLIGYDIIQAQVFKEDDGKVYLGQAISKGVAQEIKDVASSALTVNYDLFLANFNSLNKRMGELRDNANSQGVWTRVFGGAMSNDFGAGSKTEYVTAQAGYDYSLTLGDARNYMGIAVAYGHSTTKSNTLNIQASQGATIALQDVKSNMVEVGIYNSYVMDSGWYNDTIFKFDYIMSSFTMTDNLSLESETNNFAMVLSDEFGYRYKFAESEKGNWYIDPQVEVAFGYFNQSDFNRAMLATNSTLEASQDNILNLRTRAGLSLGKKFNTAKGFASLYVGAFYEYDYINGGDAEVLSKSGIANPLDKLESNGRAIVNVGSNIELTEGVRMYIDVEKSFGDKQRTDMQFNFGARYSFGEKAPTISYQEQQKKKVAPLKVEEKQEANTQATSEQEAKK